MKVLPKREIKASCEQLLAIFIILSGLALTGCRQSAASNPEQRGRQLFAACAPCHGSAGEGRKDVGAPAIAGLHSWYIEVEVNQFRTGIRGAHFDDPGGLRMRPMVKAFRDEDVKLVAGFVSSLPAVKQAPAMNGDPKAGRDVYENCAVCHGENAEGIEDIKSAPMSTFEEWYLAEQLQKFKKGIRGYHPDDAQGTMMKSAAEELTDQQIRDVVAYIRSLQK